MQRLYWRHSFSFTWLPRRCAMNVDSRQQGPYCWTYAFLFYSGQTLRQPGWPLLSTALFASPTCATSSLSLSLCLCRSPTMPTLYRLYARSLFNIHMDSLSVLSSLIFSLFHGLAFSAFRGLYMYVRVTYRRRLFSLAIVVAIAGCCLCCCFCPLEVYIDAKQDAELNLRRSCSIGIG